MSDGRGRFIVVEGGEGAGKSTQLPRIVRWLEESGRATLSTREPGGTTEAERIRSLLLDAPRGSIDALSELLLIFAARRLHVEQCLRPALAAGQDVVCDRFVDASYAYQGAGRGVDSQRIATLEAWTCEDLRPDLVIILDLDPEIGRRRAAARSAADRFEQEDLRFAQRVRAGYHARARSEPARYAIVDATQDPEAVWAEIAPILDSRLSG